MNIKFELEKEVRLLSVGGFAAALVEKNGTEFDVLSEEDSFVCRHFGVFGILIAQMGLVCSQVIVKE